MWYSEEEINIAKQMDLVKVTEELGYTPQRIGKYYTLKEMDSIRIYHRQTWCRWSRRYQREEGGGTQIDFLQTFAGLDFTEAVAWLLDFAGYLRAPSKAKPMELKNQAPKQEEIEKKPFQLPPPSSNNDYLYSYLTEDRAISRKTVKAFVDKGLIYESKPYHNIVFKGLDEKGVCRFASMRGVFDKEGRPFKCDVAGNDKNYGFNVSNPNSTEVIVFEAAIDLMSYVDIFPECDSNLLALGMLADAPLRTFLKENQQINRIKFCLDNDKYGKEASEELRKKYYELGYDVENAPPPETHKDYNEWLQEQKRSDRKKEARDRNVRTK